MRNTDIMVFHEMPVGARFTLWGDRWEKISPSAIERVNNDRRGGLSMGVASLNPVGRDVELPMGDNDE